MNIFILDKGYNQLGMLSNEGANPQAPYFDDLFTQELETGADTFEFTTLATSASESMLQIGNHIIFEFNNRQRLFAISTLEAEHTEGMNTIRVYAEGVGFQLLETFMGDFEDGEGEDTDGDGEIDETVGGEFHTYETFLAKVLEGTDWNYVITSGDLKNINMGKEVTFPEGKNIYALLQDSMQTFDGVELEFRAGYSGGGLTKTVYAYPNRGRGSFVGKRFEYGFNVKGIKKTQEIIDAKDEYTTVYEGVYNIDGLNADIAYTYDVDFALRSHEVEELEIGDTHYIIDNDFHPPLQIDARIGKIEVSFSDPTKNKCYLANFKRIPGSKPAEPDGENVDEMIDDKLDDKLDELLDEKLDELDDRFDEINDRLDELEKNNNNPGDVDIEDLTSIEVNTALLTVPFDLRDYGNEVGVPIGDKLYPNLGIGGEDLLDFILNDVDLCTHIHTDVLHKYTRDGIPQPEKQVYLGITNSERGFYDHNYNYNEWNECAWTSKVAQYIVRKEVKDNNKDGDILDSNEHNSHCYNLPSLVAALIGAFQQYVEKGGDGGNIDLTDYATKIYVNSAIKNAQLGGNDDLSIYATRAYVDNSIENINLSDYATKKFVSDEIDAIDLSDYVTKEYVDDAIADIELSSGELPPDVFEVIDDKLHIKLPINFENSANFINCGLTDDRADLTGVVGLNAMTIYCANINPVHDGSGVVQIDGDLEVTGNIISSGTSSGGDTLTVRKIIGGNPADGERLKYVEFEDAIAVKKIFHPEGDGSVEWESDLSVGGSISASTDIHIGGDLYVSGQIINENGAATISNDETLQEELRIRDEKIASLEARLARLEEMLNNN